MDNNMVNAVHGRIRTFAFVIALTLISNALAQTPITRYRLYSPVTLEHLFTTDVNEYSVLGTRGWIQEGAAYRILDRAGTYQGQTLRPYYRLYHPGVRWHHWTVDANEYAVLGQTRIWQQEGIDGYLLSSPVPGSVPLYRLHYAAIPGLHHWTTDENEKNVLTTQRGWELENVDGHVLPVEVPPPKCSPQPSLSAELEPYPRHPSADTHSVEEMLAATALPGENLSAEQADVRRAVLGMLKSLGIDAALDTNSFYSNALAGFAPKRWSTTTPQPLSGQYRQPYSVDAPFYQPIPCDTPRVELPRGYIKSVQLHVVHGFDGIGFGVPVSSAGDPVRTVTSRVDNKTYSARIRDDAIPNFLPDNPNADQQILFVDSTDNTLINCIAASRATNGRDYSCYFAQKSALATLGDRGGTIASGMSNLGPLIRDGEATDPNKPIPHAIMGVTNRVWKARVFPAVSGDAYLYANQNPQYGRGLVPYGGVIQLDPSLDLSKLDLSLPARRILEAIQRYGFYVVDTGGPDMGIYTSTNASEFDAFGGIYVPNGNGVQNQVGRVLESARLFVVPPIVKR